MNVALWIALLACAATVMVCSMVLVVARDYHAGLIGNLSLAAMGVAALARFARLYDSGPLHYWISSGSVLLWAGLALFLLRHTCNFFHRRKKQGPYWYWA